MCDCSRVRDWTLTHPCAQGSAKLYQFLQQQNQSATHFMIGINILQNYPLFHQAFNVLQREQPHSPPVSIDAMFAPCRRYCGCVSPPPIPPSPLTPPPPSPVHTWTHPYTTTLNNTQVLAQLGWAMQIIYDATGRVPRFWRAPYGDADNRVRAIAQQVFGLTMVEWNQECVRAAPCRARG